ncbi:MAG: InlB B-repeat-containing protein, partial [Clostridia bacterium]|nr:InlB B-repeat-containing protein [Clostridia bacterium]
MPWATYTANFAVNTATIVYNANGGSGSGSTPITYGTDFTLHSGSGFTRSGYVFVGWSNSSGDNNSANYSPSQTITDDKVGSFDLGNASNHTKTVTLYAVWKSGDFGSKDGGTGLWGSFTNPFVIENSTHLANLSEIVNGVRDPVNSVGGTYYGQSVPETQAKVDSEGRITYVGCYFEIIPETAGTTFTITYATDGLRPIGSSTATPFRGNFNGNSNTISISASLSGVDYVGLFGYMDAGSISNLTVTGTVTGRHYVGGVLGYLDWKTTTAAISISNVQNKCTVSGTNYVGGVFGKIDYRDSGDYGLITMTSVSNTGAVSGASYVGGIAGYLYGSYSGDGAKMYSCYNTGNITATGDYSGGLVGQCRNTQFNSCYTGSSKNSATVKGRNYVGGFVGQLIGGSTPAPASGVGNYNNMKVVSTGNQVGGYAGTTTWQSLAKFTNYGDISGVSNVGGVVGYYTINTAQTTSYLRNEGNVIATGNYVGGILGKAERPANEGGSFVIGGTVYSTGSVKGAKAVGGAFGYLDANTDVTNATITVVLTGNSSFAEGDDGINASGYAGGVFGVIVSNATTVTGTISVSGDNVDNAGFLMGGLVGYNAGSITASTTVSLRVIGRGSSAVPESEAFINGLALTTGAGYVGGIAGYNAGTISNAIKVTGDVLSVSQTAYTGGVAGYNSGTISNCSTTSAEVLYNATIYGGEYVGGIVGYNAGSVSYCYNVFGTIYGTSNVGAVSGNGGTITVSYTFYRSSSEPSWGGNYAAGVPDGATVTPLTAGAEADSWLVADGFKIVYTVAANTYLSVVERGTTTAYYPTSFATYTVSGTTKTLVYDFSKSTSGIKSFTVTQVSPAMTLSYVFDGASHQARINSIPTGYTQSTAGSATYVTDGAVANTITVKYGDLVMGTISTTVTITTRAVTVTPNGLTLFENQRPGYDVSTNDSAFVTVNNLVSGHSLTTCIVTDNYTPTSTISSQSTYTITLGSIVISDANGVDRTANYAITKNTATLTVKLADYGRMAHGATLPWGGTVDENATWGSASNPYYITLDRHFTNLSKIVNGEQSATNSVNYAGSQATSITYEGSYFVLGTDISANMRSNSVGGHTYLSASNGGNANEGPANLFDGNTGTKFCADVTELTFTFNLPTSTYVDGFYWNNANDTASNTGRTPNRFIIRGSNDNSNWTTLLDTGTNNSWSTTNYAQVTGPAFTNAGFYKYFQVTVYARQGTLQLSEFRLTTSKSYNDTLKPIGKDTAHPFNGHFNGNGNTVTVNVFQYQYAGLFGYMRAGSITNINVDGTVQGAEYVGGLVGHTHSQNRSADPVIEDVTNSANVTAYGNYAGGIIGCAQDTNLRGDLNNTGTVVGVNNVGGITGHHFGSNSSNATITNEGAVTGNNNVGGYAGEFNWGTAGGTATNSGTITGVTNVGGYIGYVNTQGTMTGTLTNKGVVIGQTYVGGITGYISATSGTASIADGTVFLNSSHVHGKDYIGGIFGYFNNNGKTVNAKFNLNNANLISTATGESVSPTGLYAGGFFGWIDGGGKIVFANGSAMTGEIDAAESTIENYGVETGNVIGGIVGVNTSTTLDFSALTNVPATATINGNRSGNATVTLGGTSYTGAIIGGIAGFNGGTIIGRADGGNMRQGTLFAVRKGAYLGFIAGINKGGTIRNCLVTSINASSSYAGQYVGGIAGHNSGTISNCVNRSTVPGTNYLGGIVGYNAGTINYSYFDGSVQGTSYIGGIAGYNTSAINNSYCLVVGTISGSSYVGGVVGSSSTNVTTSWAFYNGSLVGGHNTGNGLTYGRLLANEVGATILPSVGMDLHTDWTAITSNNFNGFYFKSGVTSLAGRYLSLEKLSTAYKVTGYAQPNTASLRSTHDTNAGTCVFENFGYGAAFDGNIRARFLDVAGGFHDLVYDGTDKAASGNQAEAFIEEVRVSGYTSSYRFS